MSRLILKGRRTFSRYCFNMIEVALAMAIIAFGMTSILGLYPVGINASRNAIAENSSIDAVEQFAGYIKSRAESSPSGFDSLFSNAAGSLLPITGLPGVANIDTATATFLDNFRLDRTTNQIAGFSLYRCPSSGCIYFVVQGPEGSANCDFTGMLKVWRSPVGMSFRIDSTAVTDPVRVNKDENYGWGGGLNIEISWPLQIPYAAREKRYYYVDVIRP